MPISIYCGAWTTLSCRRLLFGLGLGRNLDLSIDFALAEIMETLKPAHARCRLFERKFGGPKNFLHIDFGVVGLKDFGTGVELPDNTPNAVSCGMVHTVCFVNDDGVGEFSMANK